MTELAMIDHSVESHSNGQHPLSELADFLDENYYSHGIYDWQKEVVEPLGQFGFTALGVRLYYGGISVGTSARPASYMREEGKNNFKGPQLNPDVPNDLLLIGGYELIRSLIKLLLPNTEPAGDKYHGRGFEFRANVAQLRGLFPNE